MDHELEDLHDRGLAFDLQTIKRASAAPALPEPASKLVYATSGYEQRVQNLAQARDNVFRDGATLQTPSHSGDATGLTITLNVPV